MTADDASPWHKKNLKLMRVAQQSDVTRASRLNSQNWPNWLQEPN